MCTYVCLVNDSALEGSFTIGSACSVCDPVYVTLRRNYKSLFTV